MVSAEKIIEDFNKRKEMGVYGELGHPEGFDVSLNRVSHIIQNIKIKDNMLIGDIKILKTDKGVELLKNINNYVFRPRSSGNVKENNVIEIVKFFTFDAVSKDTDSFKDFV